MDRKLDVMCVFFDYKKPFDSVPHRRLMEQLCSATYFLLAVQLSQQ